jgi:hypothetical protein
MTDLSAINHIPTMDEVERITAETDPVLRNLRITQCYHELAVAVKTRTGASANWCTFAVWASKQAGQTIRKEDMKRALEHALHDLPATLRAAPQVAAAARAFGLTRGHVEIEDSLSRVFDSLNAAHLASEAIARGNKKVFEEIGCEFARFVAACLNDQSFDVEKIARFCNALRPGEPPDGQQYLRQAFTCYYQAFFEGDADTRAELLLLANIAIGLHEQTRLQPEIAEALDAALVDVQVLRAQLIRALFPYRGWLVRLRLFLLRLLGRPSPLEAVLDAISVEMRRRAHRVITEYLMTIELPHDVRLRLGNDIPGEFPPSLQELTLPDLCALLEKIDPTPDSTRGTGAADWANLPDRLHFILDMFRCYQEWGDLFEPPFATEQVTVLKAGRLPDGRL